MIKKLAVVLVFVGLMVLWSVGTLADRTIQVADTAPEVASIQIHTPFPTPDNSPVPLPERKTLTGGTQVFQTFNNCGPAALSMALSYYDVTVSQQELGSKLRPYQNSQGDNDDKSVTLKELAELAKEYGFIPYVRSAGTIDLIQQFIAQEIPVITRTWLKPDEDIGHYRVIKGYDRSVNVIIQDDSLQGADLKYGYEAFDKLWQAFNYEFLVLVPEGKKAEGEKILGSLLNETTAWEKALGIADSTLRQQPEDVYAQFNRSVALYHLQRFEESIIAYERVEASLPWRMLWYQLEPVMAYYRFGQEDMVLSLSSSLIGRHNRAYSELYQLRGEIYQKRNLNELAQQNFDNAGKYNSSLYWRINLQ